MKWYHLLIGALIAGVLCFAILRWVFQFNNNDSIGASLAAAAGGLIVEYVRVYMMRKKINRITKSRSE
jgi:hypothetical protein